MTSLRRTTKVILLCILIVGIWTVSTLASHSQTTQRPIYDLSQKDHRIEVGDDLRNGHDFPGKFNPPPRNPDWERVATYALQVEAAGTIDGKEGRNLQQVLIETICPNGIDMSCVGEVVAFRQWLESTGLWDSPQTDNTGEGMACGDPYWTYEYVSATSRFRVIRPLEVLVNREVLIHPEVTVVYQPRKVRDCENITEVLEVPERRTTSTIKINNVVSSPSKGLLRVEVVPEDVAGNIYRAGDIRIIWNEPSDKYQLIVKYYPVIEGKVYTENGEMEISQTYVWELDNNNTTNGIRVIDNRSNQTN